MLIKVEYGKGGKDRYTLLSEKLLLELRQYYRNTVPKSICSLQLIKKRKKAH
jgi:integrase/recombinase XerD